MQSGWLEEHLRRAQGPSTDGNVAENGEDRDPGAVSRRGFLQGSMAAGVAAGMLASQQEEAHAAPAAQGQTPIGPVWWPSPWGAGDEAGASNWITPQKVLQVVGLIRTGRIFEMGRVYEADMPLFGTRVFALRIPGTPTGGPFGGNKLVYHDEFVASEIGQVGTQFDGLGHIGCQVGAPGDLANMRYYNGFTGLELANANGLPKLGIEKVKPFFTRGVLADVAALKGRMLDKGEEISAGDLQAALSSVGIDPNSIQPGDAVFVNSGWGSLWKVDNARFNSGEPGIGLEAARWLVEKQISLVGSDSWATEAVPNPDPNLVFAVHNELITRNGIFNHENLDFTELIQAGVYEFVYVMAPLRFKGGTGSPGRPIAIA